MKFLTLIDNPWSKKGEIVENYQGYRWEDKSDSDTPVNAEDYPSIWQPIEEEEKGITSPTRIDVAASSRKFCKWTLDVTDALNSLTQRVKELENRKDL